VNNIIRFHNLQSRKTISRRDKYSEAKIENQHVPTI